MGFCGIDEWIDLVKFFLNIYFICLFELLSFEERERGEKKKKKKGIWKIFGYENLEMW